MPDWDDDEHPYVEDAYVAIECVYCGVVYRDFDVSLDDDECPECGSCEIYEVPA